MGKVGDLECGFSGTACWTLRALSLNRERYWEKLPRRRDTPAMEPHTGV